MNNRLDQVMVERGLVQSRSQGASLIKLGKVNVDGKKATKAGMAVSQRHDISISNDEVYVSRAAFKLASVADSLKIDFREKVMLDVGSSTGGFTDFALRRGAKKVVAVDVGTKQLHPSLRTDKRIELHEKTDIRDFRTSQEIDLVVIDVSFISLKEILPAVLKLAPKAKVVAMVKPQFEVGDRMKFKGVIKNEKIRRDILKDFEVWVKKDWAILNKQDSDVSGQKGNKERFYLLMAL